MKTKFFKTKTFAIIYQAITIAIIVCTFKMRTIWWTYFDIFFLFMASFTNLMALSISKLIPSSAKLLEKISFAMLILFIIALITESILLSQIS